MATWLPACRAVWRGGSAASARPLPQVFTRTLMAKKKDKGPAVVAPTGPAENVEELVRGLNIFKDQNSEVKVKPDSEYPDWVFTLHMPRATFDELAVKYEADPDALEYWDKKRMVKLWNKRRIKEGNEAKAKK